MHSLWFRAAIPALLLALASTAVSAAPLVSASQRSALDGICAGTGSGLAVTTAQSRLMLYDTRGMVPVSHDALPADLRAGSLAATGVVLCTTPVETTLENCNFVLFSLPRRRLDQQLRLVAVRDPSTTLASTLLPGGTPPACNQAGVVSPATEAIEGAPVAIDAVLAFLAANAASSADTDNDGITNLRELAEGSNPQDAASPGPQLLVTVNDSSNPQLEEGEALVIKLRFRPAQYAGLQADYLLWAEAAGVLYVYRHPGEWLPAAAPQVSAQAPALLLDDLPVLQTQGLGIGNYTVHAEVRLANAVTLQSSAALAITASNWHFVETAAAAGLTHVHGYASSVNDISRDRQLMAAGVAAGDYDNDGWPDLYITRGSIGANLLYRNRGDGSFEDLAASAGLAISGKENSGATFADYDGDGWLDLLVGGINTTTQPQLFRNLQDGTFADVTAGAGIPFISQSMGSTFADYDKDGDLDFWMTHWTANQQQKYLFRNNLAGGGQATFTDVSLAAGIQDNLMGDYTANFADIDNDGWQDILVAADFRTSQVYLNQRNGRFLRTTAAGISDENGMGAAVGDYDNDGDLDWFVTSIFDPRGAAAGQSGGRLTWGASGNRFYRNDGSGNFTDITDLTGTRAGGWGWGTCFADFNNDGWLDLFMVNGYDSTDPFLATPFRQDASRLWISDGQGGFIERSTELGIDDQGQGRGISCLDYDRDGDIDIFVANNGQAPLLFENRGLRRHWLQVRVAGEQHNSEAIGARVHVTTGTTTQMRELGAGSNYMSQNPVLAHFGLDRQTRADTVRVVWPSGAERIIQDVAADQVLVITP